jgi:hypothetical protein
MNDPQLQVALGVVMIWFSAGWAVFDLWGNKPRTGLKRVVWGRRSSLLLVTLWPLVLLQVAREGRKRGQR